MARCASPYARFTLRASRLYLAPARRRAAHAAATSSSVRASLLYALRICAAVATAPAACFAGAAARLFCCVRGMLPRCAWRSNKLAATRLLAAWHTP